MGFNNITQFNFPIAGSAGLSQWGSDVRQLTDSADATADNTTRTDHGTGGSVRRTVDPYTTQASDLAQDAYGWAYHPAAVAQLVARDTSGNSRHLFGFGTNRPIYVASPMQGFNFEGTDRDDASAGLTSLSTSGFGCQTSDGSMRLKARIRRDRTGVDEIIAAKWSDAAGTGSHKNYALTVVANKLRFAVINGSGTQVNIDGGTTLSSATEYDVEGRWTGSNLEVYVNGASDATPVSCTTMQTPDATTLFHVGRRTWDTGTANSPFPFDGIIRDVELTIGGTVRGSYPMTSMGIASSDFADIFFNAKRRIPAGNHTPTLRLAERGAATGASGTLHHAIYRVANGLAGRGRTLLGSQDTAFTLPALNAVTTVTGTAITLGEVLFDFDETIQHSFEITLAGAAVSGRQCDFNTGTQGGVEVRVNHPGLDVVGFAPFAASGSAATSANGAKVLPGAVSVSGAGAAAFGGMAFAEAAFTAAGAGALAANATAFAHASFVSEGEAEFSADGAEVIGAEFSVGGGGETIVIRRKKVIVYDKV